MIWNQTKFDDESHTGDRAVIESISKSPIKVIFENNAVKKAMLGGDSRFSKPWHELAYIVDVQVQTLHDVPKVPCHRIDASIECRDGPYVHYPRQDDETRCGTVD